MTRLHLISLAAVLVAASQAGAQSDYEVIDGRIGIGGGASSGDTMSVRGHLSFVSGVASVAASGLGVTQASPLGFDPCPADLTADGLVSPADLALLLEQWMQDGSADLNADGVVSGGDLALLLGSWGPCDTP